MNRNCIKSTAFVDLIVHTVNSQMVYYFKSIVYFVDLEKRDSFDLFIKLSRVLVVISSIRFNDLISLRK